ncbi:hypothetical protein ADIARSV_3846 [Arcticibacter svalbardensis MN12-7]|uniref:Uncharacterized protein n=1 Tax=Arcticibacter svalbardensis MN12-7 TaxID=1150600 RepID=R9GVN0_9SPHI|nr:hypothetical protein [Arcticibacter svalbardensis]EOR92994.1 hypothetical protein ADIARSV_3846 [Arcticibacter svalbardensis MN12-7]
MQQKLQPLCRYNGAEAGYRAGHVWPDEPGQKSIAPMPVAAQAKNHLSADVYEKKKD